MVKSGLTHKPDYQSRQRVSTYRLATHLSMAITIYSFLIWNALTLLRQS
jgi:cytochrome c oxidase assembly protein subunit 15